MTTEKQIQANRKNAKQSTGPRTEAGKQQSAKNATKHGLLAKQTVIPGEDPAEFKALLTQYEQAFEPSNPVEHALVRQIADAEWRLRRISNLEAAFFTFSVEHDQRQNETFHPGRPPQSEDYLLGKTLYHNSKGLSHFVRYHAHFSRRYFQAIKQLEEFREMNRRFIQRRAGEQGIENNDPRPTGHAGQEPFWPDQAPDPPPWEQNISTKQSQSRLTPTGTTTSRPRPRGPGRENS